MLPVIMTVAVSKGQQCKSFSLDNYIKPGIVSMARARGRRRSKGKRKGILHAREARRAREKGGKGNFRPFFRGFFLLIACKTLVCVSVLLCFVCLFFRKEFYSND